MKKTLWLMTIVMMVAASLFAGGAQEKSTQEGPITLKVASWSIQEKGTGPYMESLAAAYEAKYPTRSIEWVAYPYGQLKQQVLIMAAAGETPDVIQSERAWYSSFVSTGYIAPLNELMGETYMQDIFPAIREDLKYQGDTYAVPWFYSPFVMFYNTDLMAKAGLDPNSPPKSYEEALEAARKIGKLKDADGNSVYGLGITTASVPVSGGSLLSMLFSFDGGITDAADAVKADTPNNVAALSYLKTLADEKLNPEGAKLKDLRNLFAIGRLGMYFDTLWGISGATSINPDIIKSTKVSSPLSSDYGSAGSTLEAHLLMIGEDSKNKAAAADFLKVATSPEQIEEYYKASTFLMAFKSQAALDSYKNDPFVASVLKAVDTVNSVLKHPNMENAFLEITSAAQNVTLGQMTPAQAAASLNEKLKGVLK